MIVVVGVLAALGGWLSLLAGASIACGQAQAAVTVSSVEVPPAVRQAVVRVENCDGRQCFLGSGTLVERMSLAGRDTGEAAVVLSAAHTFAAGSKKIMVHAGGRQYQARLVAIDQQLDLAALLIAAPPIAPLALAQHDPRPGDPVSSLGLGGDGVLRINSGRAIGYVTARFEHGPGPAGATLEISGPALLGDSGGPFLNDRWELCGVLSATGGGQTYGTCLPRVRAFLERVRARFGGDRLGGQAGRGGYAPAPAPVPGQTGDGWQPRPSEQNPNQNPPPPPLVDVPARDCDAELAQQRAAFEAQRKQLQDEIAALRSRQPPAAEAPPERTVENPFQPPPAFRGDVERVAEVAARGLLTKLLLGVGLGYPAATIAAFVLWRVVKRRAQKRFAARFGLEPLAAARRVLHPAPMPPERVVDEFHHTQFVEVPENSKDRAWARALQIYGEHFPGTKQTLLNVQSLRDQILKGEPAQVGVKT